MTTSRDFIQDFKSKTDYDQRMEAKNARIISEFGQHYEKSYQLFNTYYAEAYKDLSYYLGNQWSLEELDYLNSQRRNAYTFNRVKSNIDWIHGYQRKNRQEIVFKPVEGSDKAAAQQYTEVTRQVMLKANGYELISEAFKGALITGMSFISPWVDKRDDMVSGDIKFHLDNWNAVILDPFFTKRDLSDSKFIARRKFLAPDTIKSLIPNKADVIDRLPYGQKDDKFTYMPFARNWGTQKLMNYTEYWRQEQVLKKVWTDTTTGEWGEWKSDDLRLEMFRRARPTIKIVNKYVNTVFLGIIVENELLYYGEDPSGLAEYPFAPFFAVFEPSYDLFTWKIQSALRVVRDSQTELNKRRSKMVDMIDSQVNSGWLAKKNAVTNPKALHKGGQGNVIWVNEKAQMTDLQRLEAPSINPSLFQMEEQYDKDILRNMGMTPELIGMAENENVETAALLAKTRQAAGLVSLQYLLDGLRESQIILGRKVQKLIQKNYIPEKIQRITEQQPAEEFYTQDFGKYDCDVSEGVLTDNQKEANFLKYVTLKQMGVNISDKRIVESSNLQDSEELAQELGQAQEQQAQMAQMEQQIKMQELNSKANLYDARADADRGLGIERVSRVNENLWLANEKKAKAMEDIEAAKLNRVKTLSELEHLDVDQIRKLVEISKLLEPKEEDLPKAEGLINTKGGTPQTGATTPQPTPTPEVTQ